MSDSSSAFEVRLHHSGGDGAPLLLVHGFGADRRTFTANQPALSAVADVWSLDLPGHGASPWAEGGTPSAAAFADAILRALDGKARTLREIVAAVYIGLDPALADAAAASVKAQTDWLEERGLVTKIGNRLSRS